MGVCRWRFGDGRMLCGASGYEALVIIIQNLGTGLSKAADLSLFTPRLPYLHRLIVPARLKHRVRILSLVIITTAQIHRIVRPSQSSFSLS